MAKNGRLQPLVRQLGTGRDELCLEMASYLSEVVMSMGARIGLVGVTVMSVEQAAGKMLISLMLCIKKTSCANCFTRLLGRNPY